MALALSVGALCALPSMGCAVGGSSAATTRVAVPPQDRVSVSRPDPDNPVPPGAAAAPSAAQYSQWLADALLSDRDLAAWREKHSSRVQGSDAVGIVVLRRRNQAGGTIMDHWMKQLEVELAARLQPSGLQITGIGGADPGAGLLPKASLGLSLSARALPQDGASPIDEGTGPGVGTNEATLGHLELSAELIDGASRRTVARVRVRPPS